MPDITNTSNQDPALHLTGSISEGVENYILGMEARGQQELLNSTQLPADARGLHSDGWPEFEALGFQRGKPVPGDELFIYAELPPGWTRQGSGHSMWSYIVDERGLKRVAVGYKAAFYDRWAHMSLINPALELATDLIYGEGPISLPKQYYLLTEEEQQAFRGQFSKCLANAEEHPGIYEDRVPRVQAFIKAIDDDEPVY